MILEDAGLLKPGIHLCLQGDSWTKSPASLVATGPRQRLALAGCNSSGGPACLPELCSVRKAHGWTGPGWLGQNSYDSFISHFPGHLGSPGGDGLVWCRLPQVGAAVGLPLVPLLHQIK